MAAPHRTSVSTIYHGALGALAWVVLLAATLGALGGPLLRPGLGADLVLPFLVFAVAARVLAFRLFTAISVSIDSAFYIAAVITLGTLPAAWLAVGVVTAETAWRHLRGRHRFEPVATHRLASIASRGAMPGAILVVVGALTGIDRMALAEISHTYTVVWLVPALSLTLLVFHYGWMAVGVRLEGVPWRSVLRRAVAVGLASEMLVIPLATVVALVYDRTRPLPFLLLGVTMILFNWIVKRLSDATSEVRARVSELEVLEKVGRAISATLDREQLLSLVARETVRLVGRTSRCMVALQDEPGGDVSIAVFDSAGEQVESDQIPPGRGLTGRVMRAGETLRVGDVQSVREQLGLEDEYNDQTIYSWMGTPLMVQDEVRGMLNVQSEERDAYTASHARVFEAIAAQAAVALENARLYDLATVDGLTGLYVRRYFDLRLEEEARIARRHGRPFSVAMIDLDDFKPLNDRHGHAAGDRALKAVARLIFASIRESDIACRYGGEEFSVIMPSTPIEEAERVAERIRADIEAHRLVDEGRAVRVTVSVGVSGANEGDLRSAAEVVRRADDALYAAKRAGKNRVVVDVGMGPGDAAAGR